MTAPSTAPSTAREDAPELEALLPWYAAGTLAPDDARRIEDALAHDAALASHLARIVEEREAAIVAAEALGLPSSRVSAKFFAALDAEPARRASANPLSAVLRRAGEWLAGLSPQTLALAAGAAMLLVVVQGGLLTGELVRGPSSYSAATGEDAARAPGAYALVAFRPEATAQDIEASLRAVSARIADGPFPGGVFKLRIGEADMKAADREAVLARLKAAPAVRMAAPAP